MEKDTVNIYTNKSSINSFSLIILAFLELLLDGLVLKALWGWFIADTFHISALPFKAAVGIILLLGWLVYRPDLATKSETFEDRTARFIRDCIYLPLVVLAVGYVIHIL